MFYLSRVIVAMWNRLLLKKSLMLIVEKDSYFVRRKNESSYHLVYSVQLNLVEFASSAVPSIVKRSGQLQIPMAKLSLLFKRASSGFILLYEC